MFGDNVFDNCYVLSRDFMEQYVAFRYFDEERHDGTKLSAIILMPGGNTGGASLQSYNLNMQGAQAGC